MLLPPLHLRVLLSEIIISGNKSALKTRLFSEIFLNISLFLPIHDIISLFEKILAEVDIMIYTVTFNPSLDYIVSVKDFKLWNTNRTDTELMLPGGKGLNVSTVLKNLGMDSTALGFTAGFVGDEILRRIENIGFKSDFIKLENGCSRINLKLKNYDGTEINGQGPVIEHAHLEALMKKLDHLKA